MESKKDLRRPLRLKRVLASPGRTSRVSSAYWTMGKSPWKESLIGCFKTPFCQALLTTVWSRSAASTNRRGESGSPCLTPLLQIKVLPGIPLRRTEEVPDSRRLLIQLIHFWENPLCCRVSKMNWCPILSKAFSKSSFKMTISFLEWWQRCRNWKAQPKQSWIVLPLINPYWLVWTNWRITNWSLVDSSLVIVFRE